MLGEFTPPPPSCRVKIGLGVLGVKYGKNAEFEGKVHEKLGYSGVFEKTAF